MNLDELLWLPIQEKFAWNRWAFFSFFLFIFECWNRPIVRSLPTINKWVLFKVTNSVSFIEEIPWSADLLADIPKKEREESRRSSLKT